MKIKKKQEKNLNYIQSETNEKYDTSGVWAS